MIRVSITVRVPYHGIIGVENNMEIQGLGDGSESLRPHFKKVLVQNFLMSFPS